MVMGISDDSYLDPDIHLWPQEEPYCIDEMYEFLAQWMGIGYDGDYEEIQEQVIRSLYKYTDSGISCYFPDYCIISVSGYCEGSEAELPSYPLTWPFTEAELDEVVNKADTDAKEEWDRTHGCNWYEIAKRTQDKEKG
jgi:hypothetical protein